MTRLALLSASWIAIGLQASPAAAAVDVFWIPIAAGTTWSFLESGSWSDSQGGSGSYGPSRTDIQFSPIDYQILGHRASLLTSNGWYLMETPNGYYKVADKGDPNNNQAYRYFTDPEPFMTRDVRAVGVDLHTSGLRRGQWDVPGGGFEAWSGTWSSTYTNLGPEAVTTPLGTFTAAKLRVVSLDTIDSRALHPNARSTNSWTEYWWFVENLGIVKVVGSGIDETDIDGNGTVDRWLREQQTLIAIPVPEPQAAWMLLVGLVCLAGFKSRRPHRS